MGVLLCSLGWWHTWPHMAFIYGLFEETISDLSIFLFFDYPDEWNKQKGVSVGFEI